MLWLAVLCAACRPTTRPPSTPEAPGTPPAPVVHAHPGSNGFPTLADYWAGQARFALDVEETGLPMGESETVVMANGELWSYVHASYASAGVLDRCGAPVAFPGCLVIYRSRDGGRTFVLDHPLCQMPCQSCPCRSTVDHIDQQQYPRLTWGGSHFDLVYEYRARVMLARSPDGLAWTPVGQVPGTGIWHYWYRECSRAESIGLHPFSPYDYQCLVGGPPGITIDDGILYIFVGLGRNPGAMGCFKGPVGSAVELFEKCEHNPLFGAAPVYGPVVGGRDANPFFAFRTISSAEVQALDGRFYMLYEGVRGPGPGDAGDSQFGLGLARSLGGQIDSPWEVYPHNPILVDLPGNVGLGHADLVVLGGQTFLYTSLDGEKRSRLALVWAR